MTRQENIIVSKEFNAKEIYNSALFESKNFKVIPSLGSFIEGWLLVIPKKHFISLGELNSSILYEELESLVRLISPFIEKEYGRFISFEHGPIYPKTKIGCGVDYAHLHLVPYETDMKKPAKLILSDLEWEAVDGIKNTKDYFSSSIPYLFFRNASGQSYLGTSNHIPSQLFRKILAEEVGLGDYYDWKKDHFEININKTIERFSKYKFPTATETQAYESSTFG